MPSARATVIANTALIGSWLWVHGAALIWLIQSLGRPDSELNLVLAAGLGALVLWHTDPSAVAERMTRPPETNPLAALLILAGAAGLAQNVVFLQPAYACFAGIGAYGLAGLYLPRPMWIRARPVAALAILLMPMASYLDVYLGFPARRFTAEAVSSLLCTLNISNITSGMVLTLEGGAAYVDLPCSGVRSLWTGAVFLLGASLLEGRTVDRWFIVTSGVFTGLLLLANTARVAAIVLIEFVAGYPLVAEVLHAPMGVVGFVVCCVVAWLMLSMSSRSEPAPTTSRRAPIMWALAPALLLFGSFSAPPAAEASMISAVEMPDGFEPLPLTQAEIEFAADQGGQTTKATFKRGDLTGTVVFVTSRSWLAQHLPRHCLEAAGAEVSGEAPALIDGDLVRWADVELAGARSGRAIWWFQSAERITDDHTARIWAGLGDDTPWTMVSVLLDQSVQSNDPQVVALVTELRQHISLPVELP